MDRWPQSEQGLPPGISRRATLRIVLGSGAALLTACSGPANQPAVPPATEPPRATDAGAAVSVTAKPSLPSAQQAKAGGVLHVGQIGDLPGVDGQNSGVLQNDTIFQVYDGLLIYDDNLQPQPALAESWDLSTDATRIKLNLRKNVEFHTGREFTSDDVKYNMLRVRDTKLLGTISSLWAVQSAWWTIDTPDKYTVVLTSDKPRPGVFDMFQLFNMVDKETVEGPDAKTKSVGTGPFTLAEWVPGDSLTFAKNKSYWQSGRPYLDQFVVHIGRDPQAMVTQLEAGAIDLADYLPPNDAVRLSKDPAYQLLKTTSAGNFFYVGLNCTQSPLDNKQVRQAFNYAIDRQRWADTIERGLAGPPHDLPWAPQSPAADPAKNAIYPFDLDRAKSMLTTAGVSHLAIDITFGQNNASEYNQLAQVMQADLARVGVTTSIKQVDQVVFQDQARKLTYNGVIIFGSGSAHFSEASSLFTVSPAVNVAANFEGFKSDTWTQLVDTAATEPDAAKRKAIYSQINDLFLDESFAMPISAGVKLAAARAKVHDARWSNYRGLIYTDAWIG